MPGLESQGKSHTHRQERIFTKDQISTMCLSASHYEMTQQPFILKYKYNNLSLKQT